MIYLDNAATSWPKPPEVLKAMTDVLERVGGNPGRSGHRLSIAAARVIYDTREEIARFFGISDPLRVIFTGNATHAINLALRGILKPGDHVVTSSMEHNAVMRPLRRLEKLGIRLSIVPCASDGSIEVRDLEKAMNSTTRLVVMTHASNVVGTLLPITEIASIAHQSGALLLVDAAQTAGAFPIDVRAVGINLLVFTGHKELQGPPGIGGLIIDDNVDISQIEPLICGGTGSRSDSEEQPDDLPDKFESGTANLAGIAGLGAGLKWITDKGVDEIRDHMKKLSQALIDGLSTLPKVRIYGTLDPERSVAIISFTVAGKHVSDIGLRLDEEYGVLSRVGLHCAPAAHKTIGSFPEGTVRLAPGVFTTMSDIQEAIQAISKVVRS
ncbi:MAG: aminotransferase class V-fold PLP-dependent enzyme [Proteobacteria bacterium]|nr:aminotransferase class V-fold PLP-dependent enzyme [Pseudomonadota bacterium]MBU3932743.1 aminotransferase class V-fold PLP-dependent enzyme [Pseudomonadota bacterium]MBU4074854.1 aminotransferase class V-fold PLP-dependent enzyme [Pseudomonadota bacterium]MBU4121989.1 aminotransferase class V-fold PLP-dependent enzyme [Pseudomonadota bacterium]